VSGGEGRGEIGTGFCSAIYYSGGGRDGERRHREKSRIHLVQRKNKGRSKTLREMRR
jgi:hypothetical protein